MSQLSLSQSDVTRLISEPSADARIEVATKIAGEYQSKLFDAREQRLAEQIFCLLLEDTEIKVRKTLAEILKLSPDLPRDIALALASDITDVALPIIQYSDVLSDADLINIIHQSGELARLVAIAQRQHVSAMVSTELIETRESNVVAVLVSNHSATISDSGYKAIIEHFSDDDTVISELVQKSGIPIHIVETLITKVSEALAAQLRRKYHLDDNSVKPETERTRELATLKLTEGGIQDSEVEKLVEQLHAFGKLTPSIILTSLCRGNLAFFEIALAKLSYIPTANARLLISDKGNLGFKALYDKSGLPDSMFKAARIVLDVVLELSDASVQAGGIQYANRMVERIFARADGQEIENLSYIIALIRQNSLS